MLIVVFYTSPALSDIIMHRPMRLYFIL